MYDVNTLIIKQVMLMTPKEIPKLIIPPKKYKGETTVISVRMPKDMIADLDKVADVTGRTRNELMLMCMEFALNNIEMSQE